MTIRNNGIKLRRHSRSSLPGLALVAVAIVVAAVVLARKPAPVQAREAAAPVVAAFDSITVPVPAEPVVAGTKVKDIKLKNVSFPKHQVPMGALQDMGTYLEAVAVAPLPANLPIFKENLSFTAFANNPVIEKIPAGMRAMTIKVDATSSVEGWAGSGSIVDVLLVEKERTSVVAENVKILSAERSVTPVEGSASPNVPQTVTLLVTQDQCLAVNTAIPLGRIAFALRGKQDPASWGSTVFTADSLRFGGSHNEKPSSVVGYVSVSEKGNSKSFALTDGKWIKTEVVPEGFLVNREK